MIELVVACGILVTAMSSFAVVVVRVGGLWKDVRHDELVLQELQNRADALEGLSEEQMDDVIANTPLPSDVLSTLPGLEISGTQHDDEAGRRIELQADWRSKYGVMRRQLIVWLPRPSSPSIETEDGS